MSGQLSGVFGRHVIGSIFEGCSGLLELRAKSSSGEIRRAFLTPTDTHGIATFLAAHKKDDDVWFGVSTRRAPGSGKLADCGQLGALFIDLDCHGDAPELAAVEAQVAAFRFPPSIVIRSGSGLHCYWLLRTPADVQTQKDAIYSTLRGLAAALGGDRAAAEPARVLRVPGTRNQKYTPTRPVGVSVFEPSRRYNISDLQLASQEAAPPVPPVRPRVDLSQPIMEGEGRNATVYRFGRSLKLKGAPDADISASMQTLNANFCRPPLELTEIDQVIRNVLTQSDRTTGVPDREPAAAGPARRAVLTRLADIPPQTVAYIWPGRLARGRLNLLIGDPGLGKSFVALDVAARVTRGAEWPDGGQAPEGHVLVLSAEDNAADTLRPRADALAADVSRIHILSATRVDGATADHDQPFSLVTDLPLLESAIVETGAVFVIVDPLSAYLGLTIDSYKDAHVRSVLGPLAALAERQQVAVLGIMHLTKGADQRALYRALGSVAFVAAARLVLAVAPHPNDDAQRVLVPVKSNICTPAAALAYSLNDGALKWNPEPISGITADQLLAPQGPDRHKRDDAVEWLRSMLAEGPVDVTVLEREARAARIPWRTVQRAKAQLDVDSVRTGGVGGAGKWSWLLRTKSAKMLNLPPKTVTAEEVAVLEPDSENAADITGLHPKSAVSAGMADLGRPVPRGTNSTTPLDDVPSWVEQGEAPLAADDPEAPFADRDFE